MIEGRPGLMEAVRARFLHVDECPFEGPRAFFENAGGSLHLRSVAETSALHAGYPDNQGRDNPASRALGEAVERGRADMALFLGARGGRVLVGESGTEVLFRLIRTAALGAPEGGVILGTTLEHPATRGAAAHWASATGRRHLLVPHDDATGTVTADAYREAATPDVRIVTVVHASPVTGMAPDVAGIAVAVREVAPEALLVVDGIQHASHGAVDVAALGADGYAVSPYKMFSRHGYGVGWASDRLTACGPERIAGGPAGGWELGTRDSGAYATFSDVVAHLDWLGAAFTEAEARRARLEAAARAVAAHEAGLVRLMLEGDATRPGLAGTPGVTLVGGASVERREGVVSFHLEGWPSADLVRFLAERGVRAHTRKDDHYSGNVLGPLGLADCVRASVCHYNTAAEVARLLDALRGAAANASPGARRASA